METVRPRFFDLHIDEKEGRVYFPTEGERDAELNYDLHADSQPNVMELTSTFVPEALRHNGLGSRLVEKGLRLAEANGYCLKPTCPFVAYYIEEHPHFQKLVVDEEAS